MNTSVDINAHLSADNLPDLSAVPGQAGSSQGAGAESKKER